MTFNPNIPQGAQALSQSASPIQTNFSQSNTIFSTDHVTFNSTDAGNRGKHYKVTYPEWTMPPQATVDPVTALNEIAFYSKDVGGITRGFMRQENSGAIIQMTGVDPTSPGIQGTTFIPGGFIIKWGQFTTNANPFTVNYTTTLVPALTNFPNGTLMVQLTPFNTQIPLGFGVITNGATGFIVKAPAGSPFYFFAIGY